jgi:hypothetical protein
LLSGTRRNPVGCRICFIFQSFIAALRKFFTGDLKIGVISPVLASYPRKWAAKYRFRPQNCDISATVESKLFQEGQNA